MLRSSVVVCGIVESRGRMVLAVVYVVVVVNVFGICYIVLLLFTLLLPIYPYLP